MYIACYTIGATNCDLVAPLIWFYAQVWNKKTVTVSSISYPYYIHLYPTLLISIFVLPSQVTILRKFLGIFPRNPRKFSGIFLRKIRWKCRQQFRGISHIPFRGISRNPFWSISWNPFQGISRNQFEGISLENNLRKCRPNLGKFLGISREKFFRINSWELFPRFSHEFLRNILRYSQHIPE